MKVGDETGCSSLHHLVQYLLQPHHDDFWNEKSQDSVHVHVYIVHKWMSSLQVHVYKCTLYMQVKISPLLPKAKCEPSIPDRPKHIHVYKGWQSVQDEVLVIQI